MVVAVVVVVVVVVVVFAVVVVVLPDGVAVGTGTGEEVAEGGFVEVAEGVGRVDVGFGSCEGVGAADDVG